MQSCCFYSNSIYIDTYNRLAHYALDFPFAFVERLPKLDCTFPSSTVISFHFSFGNFHFAQFEHFCVNPFPNKPWFLRVCSKSLLKTLWEKEKLLVTGNFSYSHNVFYSF